MKKQLYLSKGNPQVTGYDCWKLEIANDGFQAHININDGEAYRRYNVLEELLKKPDGGVGGAGVRGVVGLRRGLPHPPGGEGLSP
jgi:hypothetical protein